MFTVRQMRYFEALVTTQHFGSAADLAGISQPALSVQIAEMEKLVGAPLFERMSRKVILTDIGRRFLPIIRDVLARMEEFDKISATSRGAYHSAWQIGIIPTVTPYLLTALLPRLQQERPKLKVEILEAPTEYLHQKINSGNLDLVIAAETFPADGLHKQTLFSDNFYFASSVNDADYDKSPAVPDSISAKRLLLLEEGHCFRNQILALCKAGNFRKEFSATSLTTILQLVAYNFGVTLIPQIAVPAESRNKNLRIQPFGKSKPRREISLFWRSRSPHQADYEDFATLVAEAARPLLAEGEKIALAGRQKS